MVKKIVLTGAPHSGKTTVIEALKERGYSVVPESAIAVIRTIRNLIPNGAAEWCNEHFDSFQWLIAQKQCELEAQQNNENDGLLFLDRGGFDGLAFSAHCGEEYPILCKEIISNLTYDKVFLLDLVKPFDPRSDTGRIETEEDCYSLQHYLEMAYVDKGYEPIKVPLMPVNERIDFIVERL